MERKNTGLIIIILILSLLVFGLGAFIFYDKVLIKNNIKEDSVRSTTKKDNETSVSNSYSLFAKNLKSEISRYDSNNKSYQFVNNGIIEDGYKVYLNEKGSLYVNYFNKELSKKYKNYKIADNVLSFYVIETGQGGGNMLYFINEDGTVGSADTEYGVDYNNRITVNKNIGYRNIVSIINGAFGDGYTGISEPIFIDINGNIFSENLK